MLGKDGETVRVVYRNYATLYFVFVVDGAESELGILDLIQVFIFLLTSLSFAHPEITKVFVEALDRTFENVCELDLVFHFDEVEAGSFFFFGMVTYSLRPNFNQVHHILSEVVQGGLVLDTNVEEIATAGQHSVTALNHFLVLTTTLSVGSSG